MLPLPAKPGMGSKRLLHNGRSVDEYFHLSAPVDDKPAREVLEFRFNEFVVVVAFRIDRNRCAITSLQDREWIVVWPVVQPKHDNRADIRPHGERRTAPVGARRQPCHVTMCAASEIVLEPHF